MKGTKPILYNYWRSTASWRVRIALAWKGIEYDYVPVNILKDGGEQNSSDYKKLNPFTRVPTLIIDGYTLNESVAIIEYLEETRKNRPLLPADTYKRAQTRRLVEMINSGIQPL